jgi:hypothetical protein
MCLGASRDGRREVILEWDQATSPAGACDSGHRFGKKLVIGAPRNTVPPEALFLWFDGTTEHGTAGKRFFGGPGFSPRQSTGPEAPPRAATPRRGFPLGAELSGNTVYSGEWPMGRWVWSVFGILANPAASPQPHFFDGTRFG